MGSQIANQSLAASFQHLELLKTKRDRLNAAKLDTEAQIVAALSRMWRAEEMTWDELVSAYMSYRSLSDVGFSKRWDAVHPVKAVKIQQMAKMRANGANGSWHGVFPLDQRELAPPSGVSVVYVLFDLLNVPCYVGSTMRFRDRLKAHHRGGKKFASWQAFPVSSRGEAYDLENRFLLEYKPYLNKIGGYAV